jgi:hypothetical protein
MEPNLKAPARPVWHDIFDRLFDAFGDDRGQFWDILSPHAEPGDPLATRMLYHVRQQLRTKLITRLQELGRQVPELPEDEVCETEKQLQRSATQGQQQ